MPLLIFNTDCNWFSKKQQYQMYSTQVRVIGHRPKYFVGFYGFGQLFVLIIPSYILISVKRKLKSSVTFFLFSSLMYSTFQRNIQPKIRYKVCLQCDKSTIWLIDVNNMTNSYLVFIIKVRTQSYFESNGCNNSSSGKLTSEYNK